MQRNTLIQCEDDGKCANCDSEGTRYGVLSESMDEDEIPEKDKFCAYCLINKIVDEGWVVVKMRGYGLIPEECNTLIQCEEEGKCANCDSEGVRYGVLGERMDEDEIPEKDKFCVYCQLDQIIDEDWVVIK